MPTRSRISINQQQGGSWYPFWRPSDQLDELIGDIYVHFVDTSLARTLPFKIDWLSGFGTNSVAVPITPAYAHDIQISDLDDEVVFSSLTAGTYRTVAWGSDKLIIEWANTAGTIVRVVKYTGDASNWDTYFEPSSSWLSPRAVEKAPATLTTLRVATTSSPGGDTAVTGTAGVKLVNGYNIDLSSAQTSVDGERRIATVLIDSDAGSGLGRYPGCDAEPVLRSLGGAKADNTVGTVFISGDDAQCHKVFQPIDSVSGGDPYVSGIYYGAVRTAVLEEATLQIQNDCSVCCTCESYIAVYEAIRKLTRGYLEKGRRAEIVRNRLRRIKTRWDAAKVCRSNHALQLLLQPYPTYKLGVAASVCNKTAEPLRDVTMTIDFTGTTPTGCVVCDSTFRRGNVDPYTNKNTATLTPYKLGGDWPTYTAHWDCINPGENGYVAFLLQFDAAGLVTATVSALAAALSSDTFTDVTDNVLLVGASTDPSCCEAT